ncbi:MAG: peptidoglycan DD-metalloendopeptidase family protein [Alphaproteobacteria bacterium]|nr:peptidoglycan DD-metalloendopeptidase family protein [Alphaproteobacteria bacterium]
MQIIGTFFASFAVCQIFLFISLAHAQFIVRAPSIVDVSTSTVPIVESGSKEIREIEFQKKDVEKKLEENKKEIEFLNKQLLDVSLQKRTLENEVKTINLIHKKNKAELERTSSIIRKRELEIKNLQQDVSKGEITVSEIKKTISNLYRDIDEYEEKNYALLYIDPNPLFYFSKKYREGIELVDALTKKIKDLNDINQKLKNNVSQIQEEREKLSEDKRILSARETVYQESKKSQELILEQTKKSESDFQKLLTQKEEEGFRLEKEIYDYEEKILYTKDPSLIPPPGPGVLSWPLGSIYITQKYGYTSFAKNRYARNFHVGVDFRAAVGTPVLAPLGGKVIGTGNTDTSRGCVYWGGWIVIRHFNGLATLYGHLSSSIVSVGEVIKRGDIIGYTGNTGYSTGPHLHFGLYDAEGIKIVPYSNISSQSACRSQLVPVASRNALLNPLDYLPTKK